MKFIKRVFGSGQHSQQVPVQSLTSRVKKQNKKAIEDEGPDPVWFNVRHSEVYQDIHHFGEGLLVRFQTCRGGLPRISSCVSVQRATSLAKDVVVTCLMVLRCQ